MKGEWHWLCVEHGGLRDSTWNLLDVEGNTVLRGVKGVELAKNDPYTKAIRAVPDMLTAIEQFEAWWQEVGQVSFNGALACVFALREAAAKARGEL